MPLQVWLPLNGNLNNQGLSNVTVTNNNSTVDNNGKFGKCYSFNGSNTHIRISMPPSMKSIKNSSIAVWVKSTSSTAAVGGISNDGGNNLACMTLFTNQWQFASGSAWKYINSGNFANTGVWHHLVCTVDDTTIRTYRDGALVTSSTLTALGVGVTDITSSNFIEIGCDHPGGDEMLTGLVNDFRVYDHCLSDKEIKEISKGLVAHYSLSRGAANLLTNTGNLNNWTKETGISSEWDSSKNMYKITDSSHTSSRWGIYQDLDISANTTYTISVSLAGLACGVGLGFYDSSVSGFPSNVIYVETENRNRYIYSATSGANSTKCRVYIFTNCAVAKIAWFSTPKLEVGAEPTPWIPNTSDSIYNSLGFDSTIERDMSGYKYDGTRNGTFNYSSNTGRFSTSSTFNGSDNCILVPFNTMLGGSTDFSISTWFYKTAIGTKNYQTIFGGPSGFELEARNNAETNPVIVLWNWGKGSVAYNFNTWNHVVMTRTASQVKLYLNGTLAVTADSTQAIPSGNFYIGSWRDTTSQNFEGQMSDFRIYNTILSAEDIKDLYQSSSSIANNGTLFAYNFFEE